MFRFANQVIMKVTRDCNLRCKYCYVKNKDRYKNEIMDFDVYKSLIDRIIRERPLGNKEGKKINIIFHGGEPTIIGYDNLAKMLDYGYKKLTDNGIEFNFGMQSNLTLINEPIAILLSKYGIQLGVSFDGIKRGNLSRSKTLDNNFFKEKFRLLDKYNVKYGLLIVVNKFNVKYLRKTIDYVINKMKIDGIKVNYAEDVLQPNLESDFEISGKDYFNKSMKLIIEDYIKHGNMYEENINLLITNFLKSELSMNYHSSAEMKSHCGTKFCGSSINLAEISPNGNLLTCGRYSEDYDVATVMNVRQRDFLALDQINHYIYFSKEKDKNIRKTGCDTCYANSICDHGCMAFHYSKFQEWGIRTDLVCPIYKNVYKYLHENIHRLLINEYNRNSNRKEPYLKLKMDIHKINRDSWLFKKMQKEGFSLELSSELKNVLVIKRIN